jgi:hypothetical protein
MSIRVHTKLAACLLLVTGAVSANAGCGGGTKEADNDVSAASLQDRLPPGDSVPGFKLQRKYDWGDEINLVGEGVRLPEATHPADGVKVFRKAGLLGAAGERLVQGRPPDDSYITIGVARFKSASGATKARDWMHAQDLQQPCFSECIYAPKELTIPQVPSARAVEQIPNTPKAQQGPPTHFLVEFTSGPYLYLTSSDGSPSDAKTVIGATQGFYRSVGKRKG